jgi:16S rRNA (guanine527-N7)-methyltransferase
VDPTSAAPAPPPEASRLFGARLPVAQQFVELLVGPAVERGVLGPHEAPRIWERHILNCAVLEELIPAASRVLDLGSGAGLPGIPLALARPDLEIALLEPMARRFTFLTEVVDELELPVRLHRGRAEEPSVRQRCGGQDVVAVRAVAPLGRLAVLAMPLLRPSGVLLAIKGESAEVELARDRAAVRAAGGSPRLARCGVGRVDPPTRVVVVEKLHGGARERSRSRPGRRRR